MKALKITMGILAITGILALLIIAIASSAYPLSSRLFEKTVRELERKVEEARKQPQPQPPQPPQQNRPPYIPNSPSPVDGATNVDTTATLSWAGGDPDGDVVTYDVYFGSETSPPLRSSNQAGTTYSPGALAYITTYYWKIVATDVRGSSTTGPVWSFRTIDVPAQQNNPPVAYIVQISPNPAVVGTSVTFSGYGTDEDGLETIVGYKWESNLDGLLSTIPSFTSSNLSQGTHSISFLVRDDKGSWSVPATRTLVIVPVPQPPIRVRGRATFHSYPGCYVDFDKPGYEVYIYPGSSTIEGYAWLEAPENLRGTVGYGSVTFNRQDIENLSTWPPFPPEQYGYHPVPGAAIIPHFQTSSGELEVRGWIFVYNTPGEPNMGFIALSCTGSYAFSVKINTSTRRFSDWSWAGYEPAGLNNRGWISWDNVYYYVP